MILEIFWNHIWKQGKLKESMVPVPNQVNKEIMGEINEAEMFNAFAF